LTQIAHYQASYGKPKKKWRLFTMVYKIWGGEEKLPSIRSPGCG